MDSSVTVSALHRLPDCAFSVLRCPVSDVNVPTRLPSSAANWLARTGGGARLT